MSVGTLGTTSTTALQAITFQPSNVLSPSDLAAIAARIVPDTYPTSGGGGVITTGTTHGTTTVDSLGSVTRVRAGMMVIGAGIPGGTFVISVGASSVVLSQAASSSASGVALMFVPPGLGTNFDFNGTLLVPGRGILRVTPGDVVGVDNSGWPVLVSAASIALSGSQWSKA